MTDFIVRPARAADIDAFLELARLSGPGFTSLPEDADRLAQTIATSEATFADPQREPAKSHYLLMLEDEAGRVVGSAAVKPKVGLIKPFFNFKLFRVSQASFAAERRFDLDLMLLINEYAGCTEIGTLFVRPEARGGGVGRMLAQARYLLMAAAPLRFAPTVVAELRGVVDENGRSPFWDHLGEKFFRMSFDDADQLSAVSDSQFIIDLMPKYPIYLDLLPQAARDVIGVAHPQGQGALKLLTWEGFRYDRVIDIFDGGPLVSSPRADIRTIRESKAGRAVALTPQAAAQSKNALISRDDIGDFTLGRGRVHREGETIAIEPQIMKAMGIEPDEPVRVWIREDAAASAQSAASTPEESPA